MAKTPGTPKSKSAAPAQFDMNSRERKGGRGGPGGPGRGRDEKRPPSRIVSLPPTVVDRGEGWVIRKIGKVDQASHAAVGAEYQLIFEDRDPLVFDYLSAARDRSKEPPPEKAPVESVEAEPVADETDPTTLEAETTDAEAAPETPPADEAESPGHVAPAE